MVNGKSEEINQCVPTRDGQNDSFPGTSSFSSVHYNDSFVLISSLRQITSFDGESHRCLPPPRDGPEHNLSDF